MVAKSKAPGISKPLKGAFALDVHEFGRNFTGPSLNCVLVLTIIPLFLLLVLGRTGEASVKIHNTEKCFPIGKSMPKTRSNTSLMSDNTTQDS